MFLVLVAFLYFYLHVLSCYYLLQKYHYYHDKKEGELFVLIFITVLYFYY
jgi:hypothetical protein